MLAGSEEMAEYFNYFICPWSIELNIFYCYLPKQDIKKLPVFTKFSTARIGPIMSG